MRTRSATLAQRRAILVSQCALQRMTLITQLRSVEGALGWVKTSYGLAGSLLHHFSALPKWAKVALTGLAVLIPGRAVSIAKNGLLIWQLWRSASARLRAN